MVIWVAVGGRGTLIGAIIGAISVNWARSYLTSSFPDYWLYFLGGMFILVVHYLPDGIVGLARDIYAYLEKMKGNFFRTASAPSTETASVETRVDRG